MTDETSAEISLVAELPGSFAFCGVSGVALIRQPNRSPRACMGNRVEPDETSSRVLLSG